MDVLNLGLYKRVSIVAEDLINKTLQYMKENALFYYENLPEIIGQTIDGFPDLQRNRTPKMKILDFMSLLGGALGIVRNYPVNYIKANGFDAYIDYIKSDVKLKKRFGYGEKEVMQNNSFTILLMRSLIPELASRYLVFYPNQGFKESKFKQIYIPRERWILHDTLSFDVVVPILFLRFEEDEIKLSHDIYITKMGEKFQISRCSKNLLSDKDFYIAKKATHALVIRNKKIKDHRLYDGRFQLDEFYPMEKINLFFVFLKLLKSKDIGYNQIIARPNGWASHYESGLIPLESRTIQKYPPSFSRQMINKIRTQLFSKGSTKELKLLWRNFVNNKKIKMAAKRFDSALLREDKEDGFLDIMIAFEALIGDTQGEIKHKFASRISTIITHFDKDPIGDPISIFELSKEMYDLRSNIVHGNTVRVKEYKIPESDIALTPIDFAFIYFEQVFKILIDHPEYLESKNIDHLLLSGKK